MWIWVKRRLRQSLRGWLFSEPRYKATTPLLAPVLSQEVIPTTDLSMERVGKGNVQVGHASGAVVVNKITYNIHGSTDKQLLVDELEALLNPSAVSRATMSVPLTDAQKKVQAVTEMSLGHARWAHFFMNREFVDKPLHQLTDKECLRTIRYVETCIRNEQEKIAVENR